MFEPRDDDPFAVAIRRMLPIGAGLIAVALVLVLRDMGRPKSEARAAGSGAIAAVPGPTPAPARTPPPARRPAAGPGTVSIPSAAKYADGFDNGFPATAGGQVVASNSPAKYADGFDNGFASTPQERRAAASKSPDKYDDVFDNGFDQDFSAWTRVDLVPGIFDYDRSGAVDATKPESVVVAYLKSIGAVNTNHDWGALVGASAREVLEKEAAGNEGRYMSPPREPYSHGFRYRPATITGDRAVVKVRMMGGGEEGGGGPRPLTALILKMEDGAWRISGEVRTGEDGQPVAKQLDGEYRRIVEGFEEMRAARNERYRKLREQYPPQPSPEPEPVGEN